MVGEGAGILLHPWWVFKDSFGTVGMEETSPSVRGGMDCMGGFQPF